MGKEKVFNALFPYLLYMGSRFLLALTKAAEIKADI